MYSQFFLYWLEVQQRIRQNPCLLQNQELQNVAGYQESFRSELQVLGLQTCMLSAPSNSSSNTSPNVGLFRSHLIVMHIQSKYKDYSFTTNDVPRHYGSL